MGGGGSGQRGRGRYSQQRLLHQGMVCAAGQGPPYRGPGGPTFSSLLPHRWVETGGRQWALPLMGTPPGGQQAGTSQRA